MKFKKPIVGLPEKFNMIQKLREKNKNSAPDFSKSSKKKYNSLTDLAFLNSNLMHPTLKSLSKPDLHRGDSLTSQLYTEKFQFKPQVTSLYMVSTPHNLQINPNCYNGLYISYEFKHLAPYEYWTASKQETFTLQLTFLRISVLICILMIRIQISNIWIKKVSIMRHTNFFG